MTNQPTTAKSLLTKKDRESLHWRAQVKKLHRIASRAESKADWLSEMLGDYYTRYPDGADEVLVKRADLRAKALAAANEMVAIAQANGDPRAAGL